MTAQPQAATPTTTVPGTPVQAFGRYLVVLGSWLKKNLKEALTVALVGFVIGWVINFVLMAFFYDGFRADETMAAAGQGNVRNGMLIWSVFSSVAFGLFAYRRAVGKEKFGQDMANFPGAILAVFKKDGDAVWTHILWGAAVSLLATFLIARWAGLGVAAVITAAAFSPLGLILAAMVTQLWRAIMRSLTPMKTRRAMGSAGLFVGLFTSSLVLLASFFIANEREKLILGVLCLVAAVVLSRRPGAPPVAAALVLMAPILWLLFPELGLADDGGFKEAGGDFGAWARGGGLEEITGYSGYGGVATAVGGLTGWMVGAANGATPPPEGGWEAGLEGEPDLDPGGSPAGDGLPAMTTPIGTAATGPDVSSEAPDESSDPAADSEEGADAAGAPEGEPATAEAAPTDPAPAETAAPVPAPPEPLAADGLPDRELTDDEIAALSEEDYRKWQARGPEPDPDSPAGILRRARAGDPEAIERWEEIRGEGDPSFLDRVGSVVLGPAYDAIGGSETLIELATGTNWIDEGLDTAGALGGAVGRRVGQIADTAAETVSGAIDLAGMDADEVSGMFGAIGDSISNSTVGRIVGDTIDGTVELAGMDADELAGMVGQVRDDAADAVVERIEQAQTLVENMTFEEAVGHLERTRDAAGQALTDADRAIRRQAQEVMRMNPDKVRDALADGTIAVVEELVVEVATGGLGAARHADEVVDAVRAADNAIDTARAADNATDAARAAEGGSDAARAGTPDAPPVRETPDAPDTGARPDAPETPDAPRADAGGPPTEGAPSRAPDPESPATEPPGGRTGPGDTVELDPSEGPGGVRPPGERPRGPGDTVELDPSEGPGGVRPPGGRPRGPGDTVELDPSDGPGGIRPPDAPRPSTAAPTEPPAGSPPARSDEPWTEADTVRTPRRSAEAPGDTDPGGRPARPAPPTADAPNAPDAPDGDLIFEMEDGKRVNMTTNRPEPPRPGSPADLAARGDAPATPPRADPGADTLADPPPPARPPDQPDGDLIFEMEDGKRVNMTTNRPEPPRPGSPADQAGRAETEVLPPGPSSRSPSGSAPEPPAARAGPGRAPEPDPTDLPGGSPRPGDRAPRPLAEREALANEPYDGPRGVSDKPPQWPDGTRRPPDPSDAAPSDLPRSDTPRDGHMTYEDDPPYADDPNIDRHGRPISEEAAEGTMAPPLPDGRRHNPLDEAYVDVTAPEREAPNIGRHGSPAARDDAIREAHERQRAGVEQARENLDNPAFRDRMNPDALDELDDAVKPENARSLEDFRRSAGMDPTPPPRPAPPADDTPTLAPGRGRQPAPDDTPTWRGREPPPDDTPTLTPGQSGQPAPDDTPTWRGREPPPDDTPTLTPGRPGPGFTEGETVINPGRGGSPAPGSETLRNPGSAPAERSGPGGTQRLDPDELPDNRTGPGGTQRLDPDDLPDARTGPGGTQRLDPDELPGGRTGPGGTQRLEAGDLPDGQRGAPVDRAPAGPGDEVRPGVRRAPDGTHPVRMSRTEAERILGDAEPGGVSRTAPTERMPPDATDLDGAPRRAGVAPEEAGGPGALDGPTSGDPAEAARRENAQFREGMKRARRDIDGPGADAAAAPTPGDERPSGRSRRGPRADEVPPAPAGPATGRLRDPDLPPDEATAAARTRAEGMRDDMDTIGNSPLGDAGPPPNRSVPEATTPAPDSAPGTRDRTGPATEPDAAPGAAEEPKPRPRRPRAEPLPSGPLPDVPDEDFRRYQQFIDRAQTAAGGPAGPCEDATLSLIQQMRDRPGVQVSMGMVGPPGKGFHHEFVITPEGHVLDPVARQAVERGVWTDDGLKSAGLTEAVKKGIFTRDQWARFIAARP